VQRGVETLSNGQTITAHCLLCLLSPQSCFARRAARPCMGRSVMPTTSKTTNRSLVEVALFSGICQIHRVCGDLMLAGDQPAVSWDCSPEVTPAARRYDCQPRKYLANSTTCSPVRMMVISAEIPQRGHGHASAALACRICKAKHCLDHSEHALWSTTIFRLHSLECHHICSAGGRLG
jgi:hypothetical protein